MSIEFIEASILARQLDAELRGKAVKACKTANYEKLQRLGMFNQNVHDFHRIVGATIEAVVSRGNTVRVKLTHSMNLLAGPEYGGRLHLHTSEDTVPEKYHVMMTFSDGRYLTILLTGMGMIHALADEDLADSYLFKRDFLRGLSPLDDERFNSENFLSMLKETKGNMKAILVGKDAILVGVSNSAYQEIIYKAGIHPKRKGSDLSAAEQKSLFNAIKAVSDSRMKKGGKSGFEDIYGKGGCHEPFMGPNLDGELCPVCRTHIEKMKLGGGVTYFCPVCQK